MVELIFALVIIGIVLMSAPLLINQASQSNTVALQQEAIAAISAHTSILLSKHWDEADANLSAGVAPILKTTFNLGGVFDFNVTDTRKGLSPTRAGRLTALSDGTNLNASAIGSDSNDRDDIDDYDGKENNITIYGGQNSTTAIGDYVDVDLNITTNVSYVNDTPTNFLGNFIQANTIGTAIAGTSNIKLVNVQLTTNNNAPELQKTIIIQAFSCNIGTTKMNGVFYP